MSRKVRPATQALRFAPALLWAGVIFLLSDQPQLPQPPFSFEGLDKLLHASAFGLLAALLVWGAGRPGPRVALALGLLAWIYGASDEWHQIYVPGRSADLWDLLADGAGASLVVGAYLRWRAGTGLAVAAGGSSVGGQ